MKSEKRIEPRIRFRSWANAVISDESVQDVVLERQVNANIELQEQISFEESLAEALANCGKYPDSQVIKLTNEQMATLYNRINHTEFSKSRVSRELGILERNRHLEHLSRERVNSERFWLWKGPKSDEHSTEMEISI